MSAIDPLSLQSFAVSPKVAEAQDIIQEALRTVRAHLGMPVAYLSEFVGDMTVFQAVDAPGLEDLIKAGDSRPIAEVYCQKIIDGRLPQIMPDTSAEPLAAAMPITQAVPIGSHVSVPIRRRDGSIYGMFCCLSPEPNTSLNDRDLAVLQSFATLAQRQVQTALERRRRNEALQAEIARIIEEQAFMSVFQPIVHMETGAPVGLEALTRFDGALDKSPERLFRKAASVGLGLPLEVATLTAALSALPRLPEPLYMSLNAGPELIESGRLPEIFAGHPTDRIVVEVTEHVAISHTQAFDTGLSAIREMGVRVAVDDAGAGYAGLQQVIRMKPDILKLDRSLVSGVDRDPVLRALCAALVQFTGETGARLVAEGVETKDEADCLSFLGVDLAQGYHFARPAPLAQVLSVP